jgi:ADP-ribosylglycohydrolase
MKIVPSLFKGSQHMPEMLKLLKKAIDLSKEDIDDLEAIRELGEGWVAEETLAIAVYCCLKHQNSFEQVVVAAVNHSGDSDSTGAVAGNIIGAYLGAASIPRKYLDKLELIETIVELSMKLCIK